jgi:hypothetical protein
MMLINFIELSTTDELVYGIGISILIVCFIFIIRLFGAWLLRIDEVIKLLKQILDELSKEKKE